MANYFAKTGITNINGSNVWNSAADGSGTNYSLTIQSGSTYGITGDSAAVLYANGKTVTINVSVSVNSIRNDVNGTGATAGGGFTLSDGVTLTANVFSSTASGSGSCLTYGGSASATVVGSVSAGTTINQHAISTSNSTAGTLYINGDITIGSSGYSWGVNHGSQGTVNVTGNVTGGAATNAQAIYCASSGNVVVNGIATGGTGSTAITGLSGTLTVTTAVGGTVAGVTPGVGATTITRAKGGPLSASAVGVAAPTNGNVTVTEIEYGDAGASPTSGPIKFPASGTNSLCIGFLSAGTKRSLVDPLSTGYYPAVSDVRSGVSYAAGARTGTCAVPAASLVAAGTAIDNTVGTGAISSTVMQAAVDAALTAFSSGRLTTVATVATTGQQIADAAP